MPGRRHAIITMIALGLATAPAARADDNAEAARLFLEGNALMDRNDAQAAAARYRAAWRLAPEAKIALNLGIALAETGTIAAATEAFEIYLADPASDPARRRVLAERVAAWHRQLGRITVRTTPGDAEIAIDGVAPLRPGRSLPVAPGAHRVAARSPGFVAREISVDVIAGDGFEVSIVLAPVAAPPRTSPPASSHEPPPRPTPWPGLALGAAGVAAAVGAYYGRAALDRWNTVRDHCPGGTCTSSADLALADRARRDGRVADVAVAVSGIALVGAFLLWRTPARGATVAAAGAGAMVGWQGSF